MPDNEKMILRISGNPKLDQDGGPLVTGSGNSPRVEFPFDPSFLDASTGQLILYDRTDLINTGAAVAPLAGPQVSVCLEQGRLALAISSDDRLSSDLAALMREVFETFDYSKLLECLTKTKHEIVFAFGKEGPGFLSQKDRNVSLTVLWRALAELADDKMRLAFEYASKRGLWTFNYDDLFALTFDSCQPLSEEDARMLEDFRQQYKAAQKAREEIDAQRDEWLHAQAEPLLDDMQQDLDALSIPVKLKIEIAKLREQLRKDAYGFSDLIETQDLESILDVGDRRARDLSNKGDLGVAFSRTYAHSRKEAEHFAKKERRPGPPKKT